MDLERVTDDGLQRQVTDAVTSLCKTSIREWRHLALEGLIAVTINHDKVMLLHVNCMEMHGTENDSAASEDHHTERELEQRSDPSSGGDFNQLLRGHSTLPEKTDCREVNFPNDLNSQRDQRKYPVAARKGAFLASIGLHPISMVSSSPTGPVRRQSRRLLMMSKNTCNARNKKKCIGESRWLEDLDLCTTTMETDDQEAINSPGNNSIISIAKKSDVVNIEPVLDFNQEKCEFISETVIKSETEKVIESIKEERETAQEDWLRDTEHSNGSDEETKPEDVTQSGDLPRQCGSQRCDQLAVREPFQYQDVCEAHHSNLQHSLLGEAVSGVGQTSENVTQVPLINVSMMSVSPKRTSSVIPIPYTVMNDKPIPIAPGATQVISCGDGPMNHQTQTSQYPFATDVHPSSSLSTINIPNIRIVQVPCNQKPVQHRHPEQGFNMIKHGLHKQFYKHKSKRMLYDVKAVLHTVGSTVVKRKMDQDASMPMTTGRPIINENLSQLRSTLPPDVGPPQNISQPSVLFPANGAVQQYVAAPLSTYAHERESCKRMLLPSLENVPNTYSSKATSTEIKSAESEEGPNSSLESGISNQETSSREDSDSSEKDNTGYCSLKASFLTRNSKRSQLEFQQPSPESLQQRWAESVNQASPDYDQVRKILMQPLSTDADPTEPQMQTSCDVSEAAQPTVAENTQLKAGDDTGDSPLDLTVEKPTKKARKKQGPKREKIIYTCPCGEKEPSKVSLEKHAEAIGCRPFICQLCSKAFKRDSYLKQHIGVVHLHKNKFACDICKKHCSTKQWLNRHIRSHSTDQITRSSKEKSSRDDTSTTGKVTETVYREKESLVKGDTAALTAPPRVKATSVANSSNDISSDSPSDAKIKDRCHPLNSV